MSCDQPAVIYAEGDILWLGCSACDKDFRLGDVALVSEIVAAEIKHRHGDDDDE